MAVPIQRVTGAARAGGACGAALGLLALGSAFGLWAGGAAPAIAQSVKPCHLKLVVQFSPEVPNPRSPGFLSSLEEQPGFRLVWKGGSNASASQTLELSGPGPEYRCEREVARMRNDARVISIQVAGH